MPNHTIAENTIISANESRFNSAYYSEPLTAFSSGWKDSENLEALLDFIAPPVLVPRRFEFKRADNTEAFYSELDDIRSTGSSFKRVEYSGTSIYEKTLNKGLTIRLDHDEIAEDNYEERYVALLLQRLYRNDLRRLITLLDASAHNTDVNMPDNGDPVNPDGLVRTMLNTATNASGLRPNRVVFGESAWEARINAYAAQDTHLSNRSLGFTLEDLAQSLLVEDIKILRARYQSTLNAKSLLAGRAIYAFFAQDSATKDEPSNFKRFITPMSGNRFRVYKHEGPKYTDISVEHYSHIVLTSPLGLEKLTIA